MTPPFDFYLSQSTRYAETLALLKKKRAVISVSRLLGFLAVLIFGWYAFRSGDPFLTILTAIFLIVFIILIRISISLAAKIKLTQQLLFINRNELDVLDGRGNAFPDGSDAANRKMHANDLDIFGKRSLFHLLNRTTTTHGETALANLLNHPNTAGGSIKLKQEAVKTYAPQALEREMIIANALLKDEKDVNISDISAWIETKNRLAGRWWLKIVRFLLPVVNILAFLLYLDSNNPIPLGIGILLSWVIIGAYAKYIHEQHTLTGKKQAILEQYASVLKYFGKTDAGNSSLLKELHSIASEAHRQIFYLSRLTGLLDQRLNLLVSLFLNSIFLYDIQCMTALEKWKDRNKQYFRKWIETVGEIEVLNSLAIFSFNNPAYCFPVITESGPVVRATGLGHPLIPYKEQVTNNIVAGEDEKLLLVTGSNMSGKSTFLRSIGVNLLLAQCGAPVCTTDFSCSPMKILSSIRISDSLQDNTSYFMAELKRLKDIIGELETGEPALVLIDEVLRGTNSDDKQHGSRSLIINLLRYNCLAIFATHDLSLSELENTYPGRVSNYCFESVIKDGELLFDYKLHKGVATNKNASFLMEKMGII